MLLLGLLNDTPEARTLEAWFCLCRYYDSSLRPYVVNAMFHSHHIDILMPSDLRYVLLLIVMYERVQIRGHRNQYSLKQLE